MKRQIVLPGDKYWLTGDFVELQSEVFKALDKAFGHWAPCAVSGCQTTLVIAGENKNRFSDGLVVLYVAAESKYMVMPYNDDGYVSGYNTERYVTYEKTNVIGEYRIGNDVVAHDYKAVVTLTQPSGENREYITIPREPTHIPNINDAIAEIMVDMELYSPLGHNHEGLYSPLGHNHEGLYSLLGHNHEGVYSPLSHNHDTRYALIGHLHDHIASKNIAPNSVLAKNFVLYNGGFVFNVYNYNDSDEIMQVRFSDNGIDYRKYNAMFDTWDNWQPYVTSIVEGVPSSVHSFIDQTRSFLRYFKKNKIVTLNCMVELIGTTHPGDIFFKINHEITHTLTTAAIVAGSNSLKKFTLSPSNGATEVRCTSDLRDTEWFSLNLSFPVK